MELDPVAQMEGVGQAIIGHVPRLGQPRIDARLGIGEDQRVIEIDQRGGAGKVAAHSRVYESRPGKGYPENASPRSCHRLLGRCHFLGWLNFLSRSHFLGWLSLLSRSRLFGGGLFGFHYRSRRSLAACGCQQGNEQQQHKDYVRGSHHLHLS